MTLEVGDKVKVNGPYSFYHGSHQGMIGHIIDIRPARYPLYEVDFGAYRGHFDAQELELVPENNEAELPTAKDLLVWFLISQEISALKTIFGVFVNQKKGDEYGRNSPS